MQEKQVAGFYLMTFVVLSILGILATVAIPDVGQLVHKTRVKAWDSEYHNIQTAVTEMLYDSNTRVLLPVGPTDNMSQVHTSDAPALVLTDYLIGVKGDSLQLGCTYTFAADGTVRQMLP
jgi:Tfp pilus assembly protein PilE